MLLNFLTVADFFDRLKRAAPDGGRPFSAIYACRSAWISSFRASTPTSTAEVVSSLMS